jgi:5-methyltetrahydropteroyltriglutamate--homocysteine methyltransferase
MTQAANLGFPRIGIKRELKQATEAYWKGSIDAAALLAAGAELRARHWHLQRDAGIAVIPSNDFSFYDQMLDLTATLGAIPQRFRNGAAPTHPNHSARSAMEEAAAGADYPELDTYFAMDGVRRMRQRWR